MRDHRTSSARSLGRPLPCTVPSSADTRAEDLPLQIGPPHFRSSQYTVMLEGEEDVLNVGNGEAENESPDHAQDELQVSIDNI